MPTILSASRLFHTQKKMNETVQQIQKNNFHATILCFTSNSHKTLLLVLSTWTELNLEKKESLNKQTNLHALLQIIFCH